MALVAGLSGLARRQPAGYGGAEPGRRADAEGAADRGQPVRHALQAGPGRGLCGVKAVAVVGDGELEVAIGAGQGDLGGKARVYFSAVRRTLHSTRPACDARWAQLGSNQWLPPCKGGALPLSYGPAAGTAGLSVPGQRAARWRAARSATAWLTAIRLRRRPSLASMAGPATPPRSACS